MPSLATIIALVLRHGLTAAGLSNLLNNDQLTQIAAALATVAGIAWSVWEKWDTDK